MIHFKSVKTNDWSMYLPELLAPGGELMQRVRMTSSTQSDNFEQLNFEVAAADALQIEQLITDHLIQQGFVEQAGFRHVEVCIAHFKKAEAFECKLISTLMRQDVTFFMLLIAPLH